MKQTVSCLYYITFFTFAFSAHLHADSVAKAPSQPVKCTKEELMIFFPKPVVQSVLKQAKLSNEQVDDISNELSGKNQELVKIVEEKAAKSESDPFKGLSQRDLAIKIYSETLYEVFAKVL